MFQMHSMRGSPSAQSSRSTVPQETLPANLTNRRCFAQGSPAAPTTLRRSSGQAGLKNASSRPDPFANRHGRAATDQTRSPNGIWVGANVEMTK